MHFNMTQSNSVHLIPQVLQLLQHLAWRPLQLLGYGFLLRRRQLRILLAQVSIRDILYLRSGSTCMSSHVRQGPTLS